MTADISARNEQASTMALQALAFDAPYVVERLVNDRVVDSITEGESLFGEAKKYLVLSRANQDVVVGMYSVRVDEAWHAFILYTTQYAEFCKRFFGGYISHAPKNAPHMHGHQDRRELTFGEFRALYEETFAEPLPDVWYDNRGITPAQRIFSDWAGTMTVARHHSVAELLDDTGDIVISVNDIAFEALEFMATTGSFYVRELPGGLSDGEKVALVEALMSAGGARLAP
jgi:hypothetical protein